MEVATLSKSIDMARYAVQLTYLSKPPPLRWQWHGRRYSRPKGTPFSIMTQRWIPLTEFSGGEESLDDRTHARNLRSSPTAQLNPATQRNLLTPLPGTAPAGPSAPRPAAGLPRSAVRKRSKAVLKLLEMARGPPLHTFCDRHLTTMP